MSGLELEHSVSTSVTSHAMTAMGSAQQAAQPATKTALFHTSRQEITHA